MNAFNEFIFSGSFHNSDGQPPLSVLSFLLFHPLVLPEKKNTDGCEIYSIYLFFLFCKQV